MFILILALFLVGCEEKLDTFTDEEIGNQLDEFIAKFEQTINDKNETAFKELVVNEHYDYIENDKKILLKPLGFDLAKELFFDLEDVSFSNGWYELPTEENSLTSTKGFAFHYVDFVKMKKENHLIKDLKVKDLDYKRIYITQLKITSKDYEGEILVDIAQDQNNKWRFTRTANDELSSINDNNYVVRGLLREKKFYTIIKEGEEIIPIDNLSATVYVNGEQICQGKLVFENNAYLMDCDNSYLFEKNELSEEIILKFYILQDKEIILSGINIQKY